MNARTGLSRFTRAAAFALALGAPGCASLIPQLGSSVHYDQAGAVITVSLDATADPDMAHAALERLAASVATCPSYQVDVLAIENQQRERKDEDGPPLTTATITGRYSCSSAPTTPAL